MISGRGRFGLSRPTGGGAWLRKDHRGSALRVCKAIAQWLATSLYQGTIHRFHLIVLNLGLKHDSVLEGKPERTKRLLSLDLEGQPWEKSLALGLSQEKIIELWIRLPSRRRGRENAAEVMTASIKDI